MLLPLLAIPQVLMVLPFRESALRVVQLLISLLEGDSGKKMVVSNKKRFQSEYGSEPGERPPNLKRPEDYEAVFAGNIDDHFRIGDACGWAGWGNHVGTVPRTVMGVVGGTGLTHVCPQVWPFSSAASGSMPPFTPPTSSLPPPWACGQSLGLRARSSGTLTSCHLLSC